MILQLLAALIGLWTDAAPASGQVAVIAHRSVPAAAIDRTQLLDFYTGDERAWANGQPVVAMDLAARTEIREAFYRYLGKTSSRMRSIWLKRKLSGDGDPPPALETEEAMLARVSATPGAIGFISQEKVNRQVKVLAVIPVEMD
jgi:ABC-type phosphate transport system substrate-binding protein